MGGYGRISLNIFFFSILFKSATSFKTNMRHGGGGAHENRSLTFIYKVDRIITGELIIHYRKKILNIIHFSDFFIFCGMCRLYFYLTYIPTNRYWLWGVNSH